MSSITYQHKGEVLSPIKPAGKSVRFHRGSVVDAIVAAARMSVKHNEQPWYVFPTYYGYTVSHEQPRLLSHYRVSGRTVEYYEYETGCPKD